VRHRGDDVALRRSRTKPRTSPSVTEVSRASPPHAHVIACARSVRGARDGSRDNARAGAACAHLLRVICVVPIFAFSESSHWTRVLRGSTATKVLVPGVDYSDERINRRRNCCPPLPGSLRVARLSHCRLSSPTRRSQLRQ